MKWGTRYGPDFVNRLYRSIQRQTRRKTRLVCFTDDGTGINPNVQIEPIPYIDLPKELALTPWRKLTMWKYPLADLEGDVLFLDLDLVITGNLDDLIKAHKKKKSKLLFHFYKKHNLLLLLLQK